MKPITPRTLDWIDQAPVNVTRSRRIEAPQDVVWAAIADHAGWAEWFGPITKVEPLEPPTGVGGHRRVHIQAMKIEEEFLAWDEGSRFAFCVTHMSVRAIRSLVEDVRLSPDGDATTVSYTQAFDPKASRLVAPLLRRGAAKQIDAGLEGLANHVER
ncbi:SRPBCC family protein [Actinospongicola halichondriae]|uniref:SRPBCC family protein n=1 Tax=Actinospongicola halichondriae TaxID=3236844 RepID=UPI003D3C10E4